MYRHVILKEVEKIAFFKGVSTWFWSKIQFFLHFFILAKIGLENVFGVILDIKKTFLGYKI